MKRFLPILTISVGILFLILAVFILYSSPPTILPQARVEAGLCGLASFSLIIPTIMYLTLKFKQK